MIGWKLEYHRTNQRHQTTGILFRLLVMSRSSEDFNLFFNLQFRLVDIIDLQRKSTPDVDKTF